MSSHLVKVPDELLRQRSKPVAHINGEVRELAQEMVDYIKAHSADHFQPISLSAPQLGHLIRVIAFKLNPFTSDSNIQVLINPEFIRQKGSHQVSETCLSIGNEHFTIRRSKIVKIRGLTLEGQERSFRARDLLAQAFEHEIDHLDGILIDSRRKEET